MRLRGSFGWNADPISITFHSSDATPVPAYRPKLQARRSHIPMSANNAPESRERDQFPKRPSTYPSWRHGSSISRSKHRQFLGGVTVARSGCSGYRNALAAVGGGSTGPLISRRSHAIRCPNSLRPPGCC